MCDRGYCTSRRNPHTYDDVEKLANFLKTDLEIEPKVGLICGTGLGSITSLLLEPKVFDYKDIPEFAESTVEGHDGKLLFGNIGSTPVVCMQGRFHLFEGYPLWKCVLPIRVMKLLGVEILILSNAAGAINSSYSTGDLMLLKDHINFPSFAGINPLQGPNEEDFGPRFVAMNDAYDRNLLKLAKDCAEELKMTDVREGVYVCLGGPSFETVAELRLLKMLGADAVGMSTVHEVVAARHCGIRCLAFSLITNECILDYEDDGKPDHVEILEVGKKREDDVRTFVAKLFERLEQVL